MYDVIVVGAGPAGSTAAYHCAKYGLKTLILEKERMPRDKPCGGCIQFTFLNPPKYISSIVKQKVTVFKQIIGKQNIDMKNNLLMFERKDFDYALVKRAVVAGAKLNYEKVENVILGKYPVVKTNKNSYKAKIVIGADGVMNIVAKSAGLFKVRRYAVSFVIEDKTPEEMKKKFDLNCAYCYHHYPYNFWIFPKDDIVNVGIFCVPEKGASFNLQQLLFDFLDEHDINIDKNKVKGAPIPTELLPKIYTDNIMLTGDAAGFVDPLTGGGIELAMLSGQKAAKVAAEAVAANDFSERFLSRYEDDCSFLYKFIKKRKKVMDMYCLFSKLNLLGFGLSVIKFLGIEI